MAANLRLYSLKGGTYFLLEESKRDTVGTAIISVAKAGDNLQRSGIWTLTFNTVVPGVSATCVVTATDPHDPSNNPSGTSVVLDGSTVHYDVIEGLALVFSSSGSFNSSWTSVVYYGVFYDSSDSSTNSILRNGIIVAGNSSTPERISVRNDGSDLSASTTVQVVNGVRFVATSGDPFVLIDHTDVNPTANFSPGYAITFANKVSGSPDTIDILIDGGTYDVERIDTGASYPGGAGVPMDGTTVLEWTSGSLSGVRFVLATSTANTDTATIYVSDMARLIQVAPDLSGSPGTYQAATTPLQLTEDGGSNPGEIAASNVAFFWIKTVTLGTDTPVGNERFARVILKGLGV